MDRNRRVIDLGYLSSSSSDIDTSNLVSIDDIANDLTTEDDTKVLSAEQGVILRQLIDSYSAVPLEEFQIFEVDGEVENEVLIIKSPEDGGYDNTFAITRWGNIKILTNYPDNVRDGIEFNAIDNNGGFEILEDWDNVRAGIFRIEPDGSILTKAGTIKPIYNPIMTVGLSDTVAYVDEDIYHQVVFDKVFVEENNAIPLYDGAVKPISFNTDGSISLGETGKYRVRIDARFGNLTDNYEVRLLQDGNVLHNFYGSTERNYGSDVIEFRMVYLMHSAPITIEVLSRSDESWQLRGDDDMARSFLLTIEKEVFRW